jgi:Zn-dependent protease
MQTQAIVYYLVLVPTILAAITCHEFAHAWTALKFGDRTAADQGRVTLNPLAHIDPLGTIALFLVGFGWGKPVPVNSSAFRSRWADLVVSAAGPGTNLLLAALAGGLIRLPILRDGLIALGGQSGVLLFFPVFVQINLALAFFNLLPIGALDGAHVFQHLLPLRQGTQFAQFNRAYGNLVLLALILSSYVLPVSIFSLLIGPPVQFFRTLFLGF